MFLVQIPSWSFINIKRTSVSPIISCKSYSVIELLHQMQYCSGYNEKKCFILRLFCSQSYGTDFLMLYVAFLCSYSVFLERGLIYIFL